MDLQKLETMLLSLLDGEHTAIYLTFNDVHSINHASAKEWVEKWDGYDEPDDWLSESERDKAIAENSVWTLQWYPRTPIGFHTVRASSLKTLIEAVAGSALSAARHPPAAGSCSEPESSNPRGA